MSDNLEIWKDIPGYNGLYQASSLGKIRSNSRGTIRSNGRKMKPRIRILKPRLISKGYMKIGLYRLNKQRQYFVHRLVLMAFRKCVSPEFQCNHIDGNKQNNNIENLEWVTPSENMKHALRLGLAKIPTNRSSGAKHYRAKLNWEKVRKIREMAANGDTQQKVSEIFGVDPSTIWAVCNEKAWKTIDAPHP